MKRNNSQNYKKKIYIFFSKSPQNDELLASPTQTTSNFIMLAYDDISAKERKIKIMKKYYFYSYIYSCISGLLFFIKEKEK